MCKKSCLFFFVSILFCNDTIAQNDFRKRAAIGISYFLNDFKTAAIQANGLSLNYIEGLNNHIDFSGTLSGSFLEYPISNQVPFLEKNLLTELKALLNFKLSPDKHWFTPFFTAGAGFSFYKNYSGLFIPAGVGIQVNYKEDIFLLLTAAYNAAVSENVSSHFNYSIGVIGNIVRKKIKKIKSIHVQLPVKVPEIKENRDRDGDGIPDVDDACPDVPGFIKYKGCPIPDTDGDGINDEEDKCPNVPGFARYQGCPVPDTDGDGLNDEQDKCPLQPGPISNSGCPVIEQSVIEKINTAAKNIFFETGSAILLPKSFPSLNYVVKLLQDNPTYKADIEGHTDIVGTREKNLVLSGQRSGSVKAYFISKGIEESRLTSKGFGPDKPIADNKTSAGRAENRRVEIKVRNY